MKPSSGTGSIQFGDNREFNGVKIFSATMLNEREHLGDKITDWIERNPRCQVREIVVTQSSDDAFHCIALTVFYWEDL